MNPGDRARNPIIYWAALFMRWLLLGVFSFFGLHAMAWLVRELLERLATVPLDGSMTVLGGSRSRPLVPLVDVDDQWLVPGQLVVVVVGVADHDDRVTLVRPLEIQDCAGAAAREKSAKVCLDLSRILMYRAPKLQTWLFRFS